MKVLELHILQSFPVTCLNRDDVGSPKSAVFGGVPRARVSSQSWKRAQRTMMHDLCGNHFAANRTRFLVRELETAFLDRLGETEDGREKKARLLAVAAADAIGKLDDPEKGNVKTLLFFSPDELQGVVSEMLSIDFGDDLEVAYGDEEDKKKHTKALKSVEEKAKKAVKAFGGKVKDAADIAVFGRMVADDHSLMVEGAAMFSHALSTHKVSNEIDFFSAVDDKNEAEDEGAGHIGTLEFNSACYYRYIALNLDLLKDDDHLAHFSDDELKQVVETFIRASILAVPGARKNSMMGFNPPEYVLGTIREGQPVSLVNAFEEAVRPSGKGYVQKSIEELEKKFKWMEKTYGFKPSVVLRIPETGLDGFCKGLVDNV
jgi:CRISPR system Cascade subunit CasC